MLTLKQALTSSIGRKFIMGLSGLALVGFIITHLAGNLTLLDPSGQLFNAYVKKLTDLGPLKIAGEVGLVLLFGIHIVMAFFLKADHRAARTSRYVKHRSKGGPSLWNLASVNMILTGLVLLVFLVIHVKQFTLGPAEAEGYVTIVNGLDARDLHKLVVETFAQPLWVGVYVAVMLMLGLHLRHGFWSAFQSLGAMNPRYTKPVHMLGLLFGIVMAVGFIILPLYIHFVVVGAQP